ncbi:D-alanine--D-alanine ligase [bacterium]|nr:D-alanine--D-alanine ligase [bacterium]|tara:strand:- start:602 stop:1720 length:1119 start_codon:yes stop_codon:yes gene_type:complete
MRKNVCIIFGGKSVEHEISIISANSILNNINPRKFDIYGIFIDKNGQFYEAKPTINTSSRFKFKLEKQNKVLLANNNTKNMLIMRKDKIYSKNKIDIFFPMVHGTGGEDGTIQGLLEILDKPYVGCNVESSAICMDKILTKQIVSNQSIRVTDFCFFTKDEWKKDKIKITKEIRDKISFPCFVKASNLGSSVGVYMVKNKKELERKIINAFKFTGKVIVEEAVLSPEEIEISILENKKIVVSDPGRVIPSDEFYSYNAKYIDGKSLMEIPYKRAIKNPTLMKEIKTTSLKVFKTLNCSGIARIDFLYGFTKQNKKPRLYLSEVNTIPGFTEISMYPKLLSLNGVKLEKIIDNLIQECEIRHKKKKKLTTNFI